MKMPKEYVLVLIIGLFLLAYLLEAVVDPLPFSISTPYQFFTSNMVSKVPFTTTLVAIRSLAIIMIPLWLFSFFAGAYQFKALVLLIASILLQLYSVQSVASNTVGIPLEWSLSFTLAGLVLFLPMLFFFAKGAVGGKKSTPPQQIGSLTENSDDDF